MYDDICDRCGDDVPVGHPDWVSAWALDGPVGQVCARCLTADERDQLADLDAATPHDAELADAELHELSGHA